MLEEAVWFDLDPAYHTGSLFRFCRCTEHAINAAVTGIGKSSISANRRPLRVAYGGCFLAKV